MSVVSGDIVVGVSPCDVVPIVASPVSDSPSPPCSATDAEMAENLTKFAKSRPDLFGESDHAEKPAGVLFRGPPPPTSEFPPIFLGEDMRK